MLTPHPGNLFYLADGRVALLDCGMNRATRPPHPTDFDGDVVGDREY